MSTHFAHAPTNYTVEDRLDSFDRDQLLAEIDLKWLLAGQSRWIDSQQMHSDPQYAASVLKTAMDSPVDCLHSCAMAMRGLRADHYL